MSVSSTQNRKEYAGNGLQVSFPYAPRIFAETDIVVYVNESLKTLGVDYSVTGVDSVAGGNVVFTAAPANGAKVLIYSYPSAIQPIDYTSNDPFPAETHERGLDRNTMISQAVQDALKRAPVMNPAKAYGFGQITLPHPDDITLNNGANSRVLRWNTSKTNLDLVELTTATGLVGDVIPSSTHAGLPAPGTAGRLRRVTDFIRGVWYDTGARWIRIGRRYLDVSEVATGGSGTSGDPWTGWEAACNAAGSGTRFYFSGHFNLATAVALKINDVVFGDGPKNSVINVIGGTKGFTYTAGSLTEHANLMFRNVGIFGNGVSTLELIDIQDGFNYRLSNVYLFSSSTNGLRARNFIGLDIDQCQIEGNVLCGVRLGDATNYAIGYCITRTTFGAVDGSSSDGFIRITAGSTGYIGQHTIFEHGTRALVLDGVTDLVCDNIFTELGTEQSVKSEGPVQRFELKNSHINCNKQGDRIDLDFSDGTDEHEHLNIHDNRFTCFGGSGQTSFTLFHPGDARSYRFIDNIIDPEGNRGILPVTYVFGYLSDDNAFFGKDVIKYDPDYGQAPIINPGFRFGNSGTAHLLWDEATETLTLSAIQATETLKLFGAATEVELSNLVFNVNVGGTDCLLIVNDGSASLEERLFVQRTQAVVAGGEAALLMGAAGAERVGIYWGSGAPTVAASKGSLYLRTDGSATNNRFYINTDGGTTWTAGTTAA